MHAPGHILLVARSWARQVTVGLATVILLGALASPATADEDVPSAEEVAAAQAAADESALSVAEVQDRLAAANQRVWGAATLAEQATESFHGARWRWQEAKTESQSAETKERAAAAGAARQQQIYSDALVTSYQMAPELTALSAIVSSDGIETVIARSNTMMVAEGAISARYDDLRAANVLAEAANDRATKARQVAADAAAEARRARDAARAAVSSAEAVAADIAGEREALIARFAELRGISVALAEQRQEALESVPPAEEADPADEPAAPAEDPADEPAQPSDPDSPAPTAAPTSAPAPSPSPSSAPSPTRSPTPSPTRSPTPTPTPTTPPVSAPAVSAGAAQAVAFARSQIGDRYQYGAAGPNAWDCSGLTMRAWAAGGKSLPHYSVAQYTQSTAIRSSQLKPGDLLFWGSSNSPNSIYHVAIYSGNGLMIHAARKGRPVAEVSISYWIAPNFFARP